MVTKKAKTDKTWVTFTFQPKEVVSTVVVSGSWNDWKGDSMKQKKNGDFYITKVLSNDENYEFRYCVNDTVWENEEGFESVANPHGSHNSLLSL